jgi:hypothetical protein
MHSAALHADESDFIAVFISFGDLVRDAFQGKLYAARV